MYRLFDMAGVVICIIFMSTWVLISCSNSIVSTLMVMSAIAFTAYVFGHVAINIIPVGFKVKTDFSIKIVIGYLFLSAHLLLMAAFGFDIGTQFCIVAVAAVVLYCFISKTKITYDCVFYFNNGCWSLVVLTLCFLGASFWAQDSFWPIVINGNVATVKPWVDSFYHSTVIAMVSRSDVFGGLSSVLYADEPERLYHYASYSIPAVIKVSTNINSYIVYNSYMVPFGVFFVGLSAYALIQALFGHFSGFCAMIALLFLPDASHHLLDNPWFSFHWLITISPGLSYGIGCAALAWILMFEAIRLNKATLVLAGYLVAVMCILFRAQFFVAISLIVFLYPIVVCKYNRVVKIIILLAALVVYFCAVYISNNTNSIPPIVPDFSSTKEYFSFFTSMLENKQIKSAVESFGSKGFFTLLLVGIATLAIGTFGAYLFLYLLIVPFFGGFVSKPVLLFPAFVILNYIFMSLCLAFNRTGNGEIDELLHRPFVWAYFVVCSFSVGILSRILREYSIYFSSLEKYKQKFLIVKSFADFKMKHSKILNFTVPVVILCAIVSFPFSFGKNIQRGPVWGKDYSFTEIPVDLLDVASYLRENANDYDIIQDSSGDRQLILSALSDRRSYAIDFKYIKNSNLISVDKLSVCKELREARTKEDLDKIIKKTNIKWYILHEKDDVYWPNFFASSQVLSLGQYRIYKF